ncbi:RRP12-like protein [Ischnura elegans]|uniref:RRP12-like protein n=1 Tax=Ischnura elegans TaxID=197161 RepID=UPI001ED8A910|nr:RRP12-like protein [Ischnura elegans]
MGKFRPRVKSKGKRWAKGQSSSSNPEIRKFRDSAKSRFFHENLGQTGLTTEALQKHDAFAGVTSQEEAQDDSLTVSDSTFKTFGTFASDWSSCSNQSFSRLLNGFRPDSAVHKEMLAVLAAITEVLKMKGGKEDESEYFMALMTALEATDSVDAITAILSLLSMSIKKVPDTILRVKFSEATKILVNILGAYAESDNNVILRSVIGCLSVLLRAQEASSWVNSSTLQVYDYILTFTIHVKPKVRKAAKHAVCAILKGSCFMLPGIPKVEEGEAKQKKLHPAGGHTAKFCIHEMERVSSLGSGSTSTLHMLGLLKEILPCFPKSQLKAACECILKVMTLGNVLVTSCGMQALHGLFVSRPPASIFPPDLNARLIAALFQYQPPLNDAQPLLAWLVVMQEAYCNLAKQDLNLCMGNIPRFFSACTQLWLSDRQEILSGATSAMHTVTKDCISLANAAIVEDPEKHSSYIQNIQKAFGFVGSGLKYQYHSAWKHVFLLLSTMFEVCSGGPCQKFLVPLLTPLADLRDSDKFTYTREVDSAIGKAVTSFGPKVVLTAIPFTITGQEKSYDFPRSWILPVLKESVKNSQIKIFVEIFLPLAALCRNKSLELAGNNEKVGSHTYDLLQAQIWGLLPSFCNGATDVKDNFKSLAKILGMAISDRKDLRLDVMLAIRRLISKSLESGAEEDRKELSRFSKNYLPILFNLYTTQPHGSEEAGHRLAAYETIKLYLKITDPTLCTELFDRAFAKLQTFKPGLSGKKNKKKKKGKNTKETSEPMQQDVPVDDKKDVFIRESVMDLLRALLPWQSDGSRLRSLYDYCVPLLSSKDAHEQKKAYRVIEEIFGCGTGDSGVSSAACKEFFNSNISELQNILLQSLSSAAPSSKAPRIRCLIHLVRMLESDKMDAIQAIIPEAVLCIKDINEKCRTAAFNLLVEIGKTLQKWSSKPTEDILREYVALVMAGLAGSPVLISSTILALGRVVHEFKGLFPMDLLKNILENVCLLMVTTSREVVNSALSFAKVLVQSYGANDFAQFVPTLVKSLSCMVDDTKRHFRIPVRHLFERLVRRYGYDAVARVVPESDAVTHKRLNNIRKMQARKKRMRDEGEEDDDNESAADDFQVKAKPMSIEEILAESDSDDEFFGEEKKQKKVQNKKGKKQQNTWIQEGGDDSIVDFTDAAVAKRISTSKPGAAQPLPTQVKKEKKELFKTAPDGRLIITEDGGADDMDDDVPMGRKARRKRKAEESDSGMDDDDDEESVMAPIMGKRKRGGSVSTEALSYRPPMKYQAGGSGIHRPVSSQAKGKPKQMQKEGFGHEYKSNKARGDVKKKGKPDPYAYIPLSRKTLNKRKKAKSTGQFKNIIQAAKKGAIRGMKAKAKLCRR